MPMIECPVGWYKENICRAVCLLWCLVKFPGHINQPAWFLWSGLEYVLSHALLQSNKQATACPYFEIVRIFLWLDEITTYVGRSFDGVGGKHSNKNTAVSHLENMHCKWACKPYGQVSHTSLNFSGNNKCNIHYEHVTLVNVHICILN